MDHSYEEIRRAAMDILATREKCHYKPNHCEHLKLGVAEVLQRRDGLPTVQVEPYHFSHLHNSSGEINNGIQ